MKRRIIRYIPVIVLFAIAIVVYAYFMNGGNVETGTVAGRITYGPITPVCQAGSPCEDMPYNGTIYVVASDGSGTIKESTTLENGTYSIDLAPGTYFLEVKGFIHLCGEEFNVTAGNTTILDLSCDTGIR